MAEVQSPVIPIVGDWVRATPGTISLGQGIVSYGPPREAAEAIAGFSEKSDNHTYGAVEGTRPLLEALGAKLRAENGIDVTKGSRVVVTAGGNMAFLNAVLAIADVGDEIILLTPYYFNHEMAVGMAGCKAVLVETDERFQPRLDAIARAITPRTRAVITISPNNPSGAVYPEGTLRELNALCKSRGLYHIHDEAYEYFTYGRARVFSPGSIEGGAEHTISLYSFSKAYGFASWRIGYMVAPEHLFDAIRKIQDTNLICPPVISQVAALGALRAGASYCREKLRTIARAREIALSELEAVASIAKFPKTEGAFYFLITINSAMRPIDLVERLIREHRVAAIPGTAFGLERGCTVRIAYGALDPATAAEGVGRFVRGLNAIMKG